MARFVSFLIVLLLISLGGCGGDSHNNGNQQSTGIIPLPGQFAFLRQLPNGKSKPFSVTLLIGKFASDGTFVATAINDPVTGQPLDMPIASVFLSSDDKKIAFDLLTISVDPTGKPYVSAVNIATMSSDGTGFTQLTNNAANSFATSSSPQFSPDGKQIVFAQSGNDMEELWVMNADGSNQHMIQQSLLAGAPSFSPDGSQIVAEIVVDVADHISQGIFTLKPDGSAVGGPINSPHNPACTSEFDFVPTFTSDGKQISFSKACSLSPAGYSDTLYIADRDGSNVTKLLGSGTPQVALFQPRAVGNRLVFSSNAGNPGTNKFQLYSIMPDGSGLTQLTNNNVFNGLSTAFM